MRPSWWRDHRDVMPDMVVGHEAWDFVARTLIAETEVGLPFQFDNLIYHEFHDPPWRKDGVRKTSPSQLHNVRLAVNFFRSRRMNDLVGDGEPLTPQK